MGTSEWEEQGIELNSRGVVGGIEMSPREEVVGREGSIGGGGAIDVEDKIRGGGRWRWFKVRSK